MTSVFYSLRSEIDAEGRTAYRITKFADGEVESSYHTSREVCECPAGQRPTCRHRQMLPHMLNADIVNTHWFMLWPEAQVVDFEGTTRSRYTMEPEGEALRQAEVARGPDLTLTAECSPGCCEPFPQPAPNATHPWRRL